jgi:hypothetical protein
MRVPFKRFLENDFTPLLSKIKIEADKIKQFASYS